MDEENIYVALDVVNPEKSKRLISAFKTDYPGLYIHEHLYLDGSGTLSKSRGSWAVTHEHSGLLVVPHKMTYEQVTKFVERIGRLTNWTQSSEALSKSPDLIFGAVHSEYQSVVEEEQAPEPESKVEDPGFYIFRDRSDGTFKIKSPDGEVVTDDDGNPLSYTHRGSAWNAAQTMKT